MAATLEQYRARFPEHDAVSDGAVSLALADTALLVSSAQFGDTLDMAQLFFAAHCVHLDHISTPGEPVAGIASKSAGKVSVSFRAPSTSDDEWLSSTSYGQRFRSVRDACVAGFMVV